MIEIAQKTQLVFEGLSNAIAVDQIDEVYKTPEKLREMTGDFSRMAYFTSKFAYRIELNQATTAGAGELRLMAGDKVVASQSVDLTQGQSIYGEFVPSLTGVGGGELLSVVLYIGTAADPATEAQVFGKLTLEHPLVLGA